MSSARPRARLPKTATPPRKGVMARSGRKSLALAHVPKRSTEATSQRKMADSETKPMAQPRVQKSGMTTKPRAAYSAATAAKPIRRDCVSTATGAKCDTNQNAKKRRIFTVSSPPHDQPNGRPRRRVQLSAAGATPRAPRAATCALDAQCRSRRVDSAMRYAAIPKTAGSDRSEASCRTRRPKGLRASMTGRTRTHAAGPTETATPTSAKTPRTFTKESRPSNCCSGDPRVASCAMASAMRGKSFLRTSVFRSFDASAASLRSTARPSENACGTDRGNSAVVVVVSRGAPAGLKHCGRRLRTASESPRTYQHATL
mmetsp:Transcript_15996/g.48397  ORF Transcript_15996/g.48397 Transcript_15996/m.48397 type:complete len:315 (-) Transcript_15996:144-1088(-)